MAGVFLSYAREDRERAEKLAAILEEHGHATWWDRVIPPGRSFDEVITERLGAAHCVVVLWSAASVASRWVKTEAADGADRGILVPALLEDVAIPMEFRRIQAADLQGWHGDPHHPGLRMLLASVARLAGGGPIVSPPKRVPVRALLATGAVLALGGAALCAGPWVLSSLDPDRTGTRQADTAGTPLAADAAAAGEAGRPAAAPAAAVATPEAEPEPAPSLPASHSQAAAKHTGPGPNTDPSLVLPQPGDIDLLARANGGELLFAPAREWEKAIDGDESGTIWADGVGSEAVFGFEGGRTATFSAFGLLVPEADKENIKQFELSVATESPDGPFESIGVFETRNIRLFRTPYQRFVFEPRTAKYLKVRILSNHEGSHWGRVVEFALYGRLQ